MRRALLIAALLTACASSAVDDADIEWPDTTGDCGTTAHAREDYARRSAEERRAREAALINHKRVQIGAGIGGLVLGAGLCGYLVHLRRRASRLEL